MLGILSCLVCSLHSFTAAYFTCHLAKSSHPEYVSLTFNKTSKPTNQLQVIYSGFRKRNITACYPAIHGPYSEPSRLIQSIELNRALGVSHAFIYNYSVSSETNLVLNQYKQDGVLTVLQWNIPDQTDAWYYAQNAAINDCVYRNRKISKYVVVLDLDEIIIPVNQTSLTDLILNIQNDYYKDGKTWKPPLGTMAFESSTFHRKPVPVLWKEIKKNFCITNKEEQLFTSRSVTSFLLLERYDPPFKFPKRSKTIVRPELVVTAGIHQTPLLSSGARTQVISHKMAIVNHYSSTKMRTDRSVLDLSVLRLKQLFVPRLQRAFDRFANIFH